MHASKNYGSFIILVIMTVAHVSNSVQGPVPILTVKGILAESVLVFFSGNGVQFVPQWTLQYREKGRNFSIQEVNTTANEYYIYRLHGLKPFTNYELRARPMSIRDGNLTNSTFSNWTTFKTAPYTVFGRVDLLNITYTANHEVQQSTEWNSTLEVIKEAYNATDYKSLEVIEIENIAGKVRLHYKSDVGENSQPNITELKLNGPSFENSFITYKGLPDGTTYAYKTDDAKGETFTLVYISESTCSKIVERYVIMTLEHGREVKIHLNVASSKVATADEHDGIVFSPAGEKIELLRDDDISVWSLSRDQIIAITPMFRIRDCLKFGGDESLYTEVYKAEDANDPSPTYIYFTYTPELLATALIQSGVTAISVKGVTTSLIVPALENAVQYSYLNGTEVLATITDPDAMMKEIWTMDIPPQNFTMLELTPRGTFLKHSGTKYTVNGSPILFWLRGDQCANCSDFAFCTTHVATGESSCECMEGYTGDGFQCDPPTTTGMELSTLVTEIADTTTAEESRLTTENDRSILIPTTKEIADTTTANEAGFTTEDGAILIPATKASTTNSAVGDQSYIIAISAAIFVLLVALALFLLHHRHRRIGDYNVSKNIETMPHVTLKLQVIETNSAHIVNRQETC